MTSNQITDLATFVKNNSSSNSGNYLLINPTSKTQFNTNYQISLENIPDQLIGTNQLQSGCIKGDQLGYGIISQANLNQTLQNFFYFGYSQSRTDCYISKTTNVPYPNVTTAQSSGYPIGFFHSNYNTNNGSNPTNNFSYYGASATFPQVLMSNYINYQGNPNVSLQFTSNRIYASNVMNGTAIGMYNSVAGYVSSITSSAFSVHIAGSTYSNTGITFGALTQCPQNNNKKQSEGLKALQSRRLPSIRKQDPLPGPTVEGADLAPSPAKNPNSQHLRLEGDKYQQAGHHSLTLKTLEIALKAMLREKTGQDSIQKLANSGTIVDALKTQINEGRVLVEVKQLKFLKWTEVQQLAQNLAPGVLEQAVSIATINKNAERNYKKELKQLKQFDDDPTHSLNLKVNAFNKYYDQLIKTDKKSDAAKKYKSNKSSQKEIDQKSKSNQNQNQSDGMDVEYMKTNKNNNQKKNNQQKSPHNQNQTQSEKIPMDEEIDFEKKEIKTILKKNNNTNSEKKQNVQKKQTHENLNKNQNEIPKYKVSLKSPQTSQEYSNQNESDDLQDDQIIQKASKLYKQVAQHLDPFKLNEIAKNAKENETFPDDTQHRLVAKNLEINQMWDSRLIQMFTNEPYYILQMLDSAKINSRDLRKKIKYGIYINAYLLYILKQNFGLQKFDVEEGVYHNIALLMLVPIINILRNLQVIEQSDTINTQGLMEVLYQAYKKGEKNAYKVNHIIQINTSQEKPILVIINITKQDAKEFQSE
ncbi:hypothetical protein ABPG72_021752 [Tetrahymena utriculariae]